MGEATMVREGIALPLLSTTFPTLVPVLGNGRPPWSGLLLSRTPEALIHTRV